MLEELHRFPHQHIVSHIACWRQDDIDYILLPKARCDLKAMLTRQDAPYVNRETVKWLFSQLHGLADAMKHFHALGNQGNSTSLNTNVRWAYHHDIKPTNILVFERELNFHPILKLNDFGAGRISSPNEKGRSHTESEVFGTTTYFAPEAEPGGEGASRPFDMWSLGCVFLEMLVWLFRLFEEEGDGDEGGGIAHHVERFRDLREKFSGANPNNLEDKFYWKPPGAQSYAVKPAVKKVIAKLKSQRCRDMWAFDRLIDAITKLLVVDIDQRLTAAQLEEVLRRIRLGVDREIREMEPNRDIYSSQYEANRSDTPASGLVRKPGQPTIHTGITMIDSDASPRGPSPVDERSVESTADDSHLLSVVSAEGLRTSHSPVEWENKDPHVSAPSTAKDPDKDPNNNSRILTSTGNIKDLGVRHEFSNCYISDWRLHEYLESRWPAGEGSQYATRVSSHCRLPLHRALITYTTVCRRHLGDLDPGPT